jgi:hypothetical protein
MNQETVMVRTYVPDVLYCTIVLYCTALPLLYCTVYYTVYSTVYYTIVHTIVLYLHVPGMGGIWDKGEGLYVA